MNAPFEPGSTLKPFIAGRMIESGTARLDDVVETFNGTWQQCRRTLTDVHKADHMTLAQVIQYSSNIGIAHRITSYNVCYTKLLRPLGFIKGYSTTLLRADTAWDEETKQEFLTIINYDAYQTPIRPVQSGQPTGQLTGQENEQPSGHLNTSNGAACASDAGQENEQPSGHQTGHLTGSEEQQLITTINNKIKDQNLSVSASPSDEPTPNNPEDRNNFV